MNSRSILNLCLKVIGLYYALSALDRLPSSITEIILTKDAWKYSATNDPLQMMINYKAAALANLLIPLILFLISLVVIFKSEKISKLILKDECIFHGENGDTISILNISIKIVGFFSLISSIPSISAFLSKLSIMKGSISLYDNRGKTELASSAIRALLYICVSGALIYFSSSIAKKVSAHDEVGRNET